MDQLFIPPAPPYFAVIFTSIQPTNLDQAAYEQTALQMEELVQHEEGFLGLDFARSGIGITISYWKDEASIRKWKMNEAHRSAQNQGKSAFYTNYVVHVCEVTRSYSF